MTDGNNSDMYVENPLELQMLFSNGLYLLNDVSKPDDLPVISSGVSVNKLAVNDDDHAVPAVEPTPEITAPEKKEVHKPETPAPPAVPQIAVYTRPLRILLDLSDPRLSKFPDVSDLLMRMLSIVKFEDQTITSDRVDIVDLSKEVSGGRAALLSNAAIAIVFGGRNSQPDTYNALVIAGCKTLITPPIPEIMATPNSKKLFADKLKAHFSA